MIGSSSTRRPSAARIPSFDRALQQHYDVILARVTLPNSHCDRPRVIGLTSSVRSEGVSTVTAHLALTAAAQHDAPVLLVDANFARPVLHRWFDLDLSPGLADFLSTGDNPATLTQATAVANLHVMTAGSNVSAFPYSTRGVLNDLRESLVENHGLTLVDLPPIQSDSVALRMAPLLDGIVMVIEAERTSADIVRRSRELLEATSRPLLGVVLNKQRTTMPVWLK